MLNRLTATKTTLTRHQKFFFNFWTDKLKPVEPSKSGPTKITYPIIAEESIMAHRGHGTCSRPPQFALRFDVEYTLADRICCFNRHYAEHYGYAFEGNITLNSEL
jgi:hypothetical protein